MTAQSWSYMAPTAVTHTDAHARASLSLGLDALTLQLLVVTQLVHTTSARYATKGNNERW
jgi:hypothetical protein